MTSKIKALHMMRWIGECAASLTAPPVEHGRSRTGRVAGDKVAFVAFRLLACADSPGFEPGATRPDGKPRVAWATHGGCSISYLDTNLAARDRNKLPHEIPSLMSPKTWRRAIQWLTRLGLLKVTRRPGEANIYELLPEGWRSLASKLRGLGRGAVAKLGDVLPSHTVIRAADYQADPVQVEAMPSKADAAAVVREVLGARCIEYGGPRGWSRLFRGLYAGDLDKWRTDWSLIAGATEGDVCDSLSAMASPTNGRINWTAERLWGARVAAAREHAAGRCTCPHDTEPHDWREYQKVNGIT